MEKSWWIFIIIPAEETEKIYVISPNKRLDIETALMLQLQVAMNNPTAKVTPIQFNEEAKYFRFVAEELEGLKFNEQEGKD